MRTGAWLRTRVRAHAAYWVPRLALSGWAIEIKFRATDAVREQLLDANAVAHIHRNRMSAAIYFNERTIGRDIANDEQLEWLVVHELIHVLTDLGEARTNVLAWALVRERRGRDV